MISEFHTIIGKKLLSLFQPYGSSVTIALSPLWFFQLSINASELFCCCVLTLKYSSRPLQVILLPLISLTSRFLGLSNHGTSTFRLPMNSESISTMQVTCSNQKNWSERFYFQSPSVTLNYRSVWRWSLGTAELIFYAGYKQIYSEEHLYKKCGIHEKSWIHVSYERP